MSLNKDAHGGFHGGGKVSAEFGRPAEAMVLCSEFHHYRFNIKVKQQLS